MMLGCSNNSSSGLMGLFLNPSDDSCSNRHTGCMQDTAATHNMHGCHSVRGARELRALVNPCNWDLVCHNTTQAIDRVTIAYTGIPARACSARLSWQLPGTLATKQGQAGSYSCCTVCLFAPAPLPLHQATSYVCDASYRPCTAAADTTAAGSTHPDLVGFMVAQLQ
jgi:hypothetical protein